MSSRQLWPVAALGTAGAVLVGRDGSPAWQVARVLVVVTVTAAVLLAVARTVVCLVRRTGAAGRRGGDPRAAGARLAAARAGRRAPRRRVQSEVMSTCWWSAAPPKRSASAARGPATPRWSRGAAGTAGVEAGLREWLESLPPESFWVSETPGPLLEGELDRARRWGVDVAAALARAR